MTITVVIPHFFVAREPNLPVLVQRLLDGTTPPDAILIWNNDAPIRVALPPIVSVLQSPVNVGCQGRFVAALEVQTDAVLFHDNDVAVRPRTLEALARWATTDPHAIWTLDGRTATAAAYRQWPKVRSATGPTPVPVTIALGRVELVRRGVVEYLLRAFPWGSAGAMDDLAFSSRAEACGIPIFVPPTAEDERFDNLSEYGEGWRRTPGYYDRRQAVAAHLFPTRAEVPCGG